MPAGIILIGLGANYPNPGVYPEIDFAQGPSGPAPGPRNILVLGNKTASGTATAETVVYGPDTQTPCQTENDVISLFGAGSHHHRALLRIAKVMGTKAPIGIYYLAVAASAGAAATSTITVTGAATTNGNVRVWVVDDFVDTPVNNGDAQNTIATNIAASINTKTRWPVTAAAATNVVTITAKIAGLEGNWIKTQALITPSNITTTVSGTTNSFMAGGTTADNVSNALATILPSRYYYILCHDSDATNSGKVLTQVNNQALPTTNLRQRVFYGSADTLANQITLATGNNAPRGEQESAVGSDLTPLEIAANNMAIYALLENSGGRPGPSINNYSSFPNQAQFQSLWTIPGTRSGPAGGWTNVQIQSALNNGITPLMYLGVGGGTTQLVKRVTTRSLNGATQDYRIRDAHKVTICDFFTDDAVALLTLQFGGKDLLNDPVQGQAPQLSGSPVPQATTARLIGDALKGLVDVYANAGQLQNASVIKQSMISQRELSPTTRVSQLVPLQPVDILDQIALLVQQVA